MNVPTPVMTGLTWQDFLHLPEEHRHASLINGELYVSAPTFLHQVVASRLLAALIAWTDGGQRRGIATHEPAVRITHDRGYMPDVAWWREEKCAPPEDAPAVDGPPDLVAEVLSPSTQRIDNVRKRNDYPAVGVSELWLIDPDRLSAQIVRFSAGREAAVRLSADDALASPQLPGFSVVLGDLVGRPRARRQRPG